MPTSSRLFVGRRVSTWQELRISRLPTLRLLVSLAAPSIELSLGKPLIFMAFYLPGTKETSRAGFAVVSTHQCGLENDDDQVFSASPKKGDPAAPTLLGRDV